VQHVEAAALSRELEVGALIVDGEARRVVVDLDAGLLSEFRDVLREQGWVSRAPARDIEGHALKRFLAALRRRFARRQRQRNKQRARTGLQNFATRRPGPRGLHGRRLPLWVLPPLSLLIRVRCP